jgi:hypothetical protein
MCSNSNYNTFAIYCSLVRYLKLYTAMTKLVADGEQVVLKMQQSDVCKAVAPNASQLVQTLRDYMTATTKLNKTAETNLILQTTAELQTHKDGFTSSSFKTYVAMAATL